MSHGIDVASYAAPRYAEPSDDPDPDDELTADIVKVLESNPVAELYGDEEEDR